MRPLRTFLSVCNLHLVLIFLAESMAEGGPPQCGGNDAIHFVVEGEERHIHRHVDAPGVMELSRRTAADRRVLDEYGWSVGYCGV